MGGIYNIIKINLVLLFLLIPLLTYSQGELEVTDQTDTIVIASGDFVPSSIDGTDFGSVTIGDSKQNTFIFDNIANGSFFGTYLTSFTVEISGPDASDFSPISTNYIWGLSKNNIIYNVITFSPSSVGLKTATVTITFENGINSPYTFKIQGYGDPYCTPTNINNYNTYFVSDVSLGTLSNTTAGTTGAYTNYSTTIAPVNVIAGGTLNGSISVDLNGWNDFETNHLNIWIDLNQDLDFDDPDEHYLVLVSDPINIGSGTKTVTVPVSIPIPSISADVLEGNTRMRIGFTHNNRDSYTYCNFNYNSGEVEDYTINIVDACSTNTWTGAVSSDWNNAANWSCGEVPIITTNVLIPAGTLNDPIIHISPDANGLANNIEIETGATLTIEDNYIEIDGTLLLNGDIFLEGEGQLLQNDGSVLDTASSGNIEIDQQGAASTYAYNYWGSPVGGSYALEDVLYDGIDPVNFVGGLNGSLGTPVNIANRWIYTYVGSGAYIDWKSVGSTGTINAGEGFSMKGPDATASATVKQNYTFKGLPNNGTISLPVSVAGEYLVANPYPSAISVTDFLIDNRPSELGGTGALSSSYIVFWEQFSPTNHNLAEYQGGYWIVNASGVLKDAESNRPDGVGSGGVSSKTPGLYVPVAQGFFVEVSGGGDIEFNNSQRAFVPEDGSGDAVFMKENTSKSKVVNKTKSSRDLRPKFRLGFEAPQVAHRQLLLTIDENTTDGVDWAYDGEIIGVAPDDMFWVLEENDDKYVIQGLPDAHIDREIPLGIVMGKTGSATIQIDALENVDESVELYIKDALLGTTTKINNAPLEIELEAGTYKDRFSLVFKPDKTLDLDDEILKNGLNVFMNNNTHELQINNATNAELLGVKLYNSLGQELRVWTKNLENTSIALPVNNTVTGMYVVQLQTSTGTISKKVIIK